MEIGKLFNLFAAETPQVQDNSQDYIKYTVGLVCVCTSLVFFAYKYFQHHSSQPIATSLNGKVTPGSPVTKRITAASAFVSKLLSDCRNAILKGVKECIETHNVSLNCLGDESTLLIEVCKNCTLNRESDYTEVAAYLIAKGVLVNQTDKTGNTALLYAASKGFNELTKLLIANGADVNYVRRSDCNDGKQLVETPLFVAVSNGHLEVAETLFLNPQAALIDEASKDESFLHVATRKGDPLMVQLLIKYGLDPDARNNKRQTPLHVAAEQGFDLVIEVLLGNHATMDAETADQRTPLFCAVEKGNAAAARCLFNYGANIQLKPKTMSALHIAAMNGQIEVIKALLESGKEINLDVVNELNQTPLHCASLAGQTAVVKFLIEHGASKEAKDIKGRSPIALAKDDATRKIIGTTKRKTKDELANKEDFEQKKSFLHKVLPSLNKKT